MPPAGMPKKPEDIRLENAMNNIRNKIVVMSGKGGVGKSTVATNLALALSMKGAKVGLMDVDIHGPNIPKMLNIEDEKPEADHKGMFPIEVTPNLKVMSMAFLLKDRDTPVIWRGPMKMGAIKQFLSEVHWGKLDYLIVDLPPGTGDEPLSIAQLIPNATGSIIVTTPQDVALLDSRKSVNFSKTLKLPVLGIVENMSGFECPHCKKAIDLFKKGGGEAAAKEMNVRFLGGIPLDAKVVETGDSGKPFVLSHSKSKTAKAFQKIVDIIDKKFGKEEKK